MRKSYEQIKTTQVLTSYNVIDFAENENSQRANARPFSSHMMKGALG